MKDRFDEEIKLNDKVYFIDHYYDWSFKNLEKGTVIGFTSEYVKIKPDNIDVLKYNINKKYVRRYNKYIIVIGEDWKDKYLRLLAEMENFKKNNIKRANELGEQGKRNVLFEMIDIRDDFDRALENIKNESDKEGIQLMINKFDNTLRKFGVNRYVRPATDDQLVSFDSERYEAISVLPTNDKDKDNKIAYIIKPGYEINKEIFRIGTCVVYKYGE